MSRGHWGGKSSDRLRRVRAGLSSLRQTGRRGLMLFSGKISLGKILTSSQVITYTCSEEKAEQHGQCFPGSTVSFPIWFSLGLIWLTLVSHTERCSHGKAYRLCVPPGAERSSQAVSPGQPSTPTGGKRTSKDLKTEHTFTFLIQITLFGKQ